MKLGPKCLRTLLSCSLIIKSFKLSNFAICGSPSRCCLGCICLDDHVSVKQDIHSELIQTDTNDGAMFCGLYLQQLLLFVLCYNQKHLHPKLGMKYQIKVGAFTP